MKLLADASLPNLEQLFPYPFEITQYHTQQQASDLIHSQNILLCRSTLRVDENLLSKSAIHTVATASSGVDHIDVNYLSQHNLRLIDAKGCNAVAVADYVTTILACLTNHVQFNGHKAGIIGYGAVGTFVAQRLRDIGFNVIAYDPLLISQKNIKFNDLINCDLLSIHANLHDNYPFPSRNLLNADFINSLNPGTIIINASRGDIVDEWAILNSQSKIIYCTDVYTAEPDINPDIIKFATICTPHIAGHSIEGKQRALTIIRNKLIASEVPDIDKLSMTNEIGHQANTDKLLESSSHSSWQDFVLSIYNPLEDTRFLKLAANKKMAFISRRKAHCARHDFNLYNSSRCDAQTQLILGAKNSF